MPNQQRRQRTRQRAFPVPIAYRFLVMRNLRRLYRRCHALRLLTLALTLAASVAAAGPEAFDNWAGHRRVWPGCRLLMALRLRPMRRFRVAFDLAEAGGSDSVNRGLESVARFINMHVRAGVPREHISLAVVVHGAAALDLVRGRTLRRAERERSDLVAELIKALVSVSSFAAKPPRTATSAASDLLLPGVTMALSAMTAHALLQQRGYTLNPF